MSRYIDADTLRERLQSLAYDDWNQGISISFSDACNEIIDIIEEQPTADVRENVQSEWVRLEGRGVYCNACQQGWDFIQGVPEEVGRGRYKYCPNCGAKMEEE